MDDLITLVVLVPLTMTFIGLLPAVLAALLLAYFDII